MSWFSRTIWFLVLLLSVASPAARELPGPSADLLAAPHYSAGIGLLYTCVRNFYVATTGNDSNSGSQASPWLTIQNADSSSRQPGDCINVAAGTYTWSSAFVPTHGGNQASPTGYVVYRCEVLDQCFIAYDGAGGTGTYAWGFTNPYYIVDGFDMDGGESLNYGGLANICFASSLPDTGTPGHHIWVLNSNVHGCGLACFTFSDSEFYYVLHNNISDCAWTSQFEGSGLGFVSLKRLGDNLNPYAPYTLTSFEQAYAPFHNMASWNRVFNNGCTTCTNLYSQFSTTGNTNGTQTLSGLASVGNTASFTGTLSGTNLAVTGITGTIGVGDQIPALTTAGVFQWTTITAVVTPGSSYTVNNPYATPVGPEAMTSATIAPSILVTGPGIQPMTYVTAVSGSTVTLSRPALTTQSGGNFTFTSLPGGHSDGNGIIMDTWCSTSCGGTGSQPYNYTNAQTLISFNDIQFNGCRAIHGFGFYNTTAINNSTYHNGIDLFAGGLCGELSEQGGINNSWYSNNAWAVQSIVTSCNFSGVPCNFAVVAGNGRGITDTNIIWMNNVAGGAGVNGNSIALFNNDAGYWVPANNKGNIDPKYTDETSLTMGNLVPATGSPAIDYANGSSFPFIPREVRDSGAWQTGGLRLVDFIEDITSQFTGQLSLNHLSPIPIPLSCAEATAWLARISSYDRVHHDAYSNLICGMVNAGIWCGSKIDVLYVFETYSQAAANLNLCSTNYTAIPNGSPVWVKDKGYSGVNQSSTVYIDTQFNPSTAVSPNYSLDVATVGVWNNDNVASSGFGGAVLGVRGGPLGGETDIFPYVNAGGSFNFEGNVNNLIFDFSSSVLQPSGLGFFVMSRTSASAVAGLWNNVQQFAYSQAGIGMPQFNLFILAENASGSPVQGAPHQVGAAFIGNLPNSTDQGNLCHLLNVFTTAVGNGQAGTC